MTTASQELAYSIDSAHASASFAVRHLMVSKVRGHFSRVTGAITMPGKGLIPLAIEAEIEAASIDTREPQRDAHLRSEDFLHAEKFPKLTFVSTSIESRDDSRFDVHGELTIRGTSRPVTLEAETQGRGKDPYGNDRVGFEARTKINRKNFGLTWNQLLETGGVTVGDEVEITLDVEAVHPLA